MRAWGGLAVPGAAVGSLRATRNRLLGAPPAPAPPRQSAGLCAGCGSGCKLCPEMREAAALPAGPDAKREYTHICKICKICRILSFCCLCRISQRCGPGIVGRTPPADKDGRQGRGASGGIATSVRPLGKFAPARFSARAAEWAAPTKGEPFVKPGGAAGWAPWFDT